MLFAGLSPVELLNALCVFTAKYPSHFMECTNLTAVPLSNQNLVQVKIIVGLSYGGIANVNKYLQSQTVPDNTVGSVLCSPLACEAAETTHIVLSVMSDFTPYCLDSLRVCV